VQKAHLEEIFSHFGKVKNVELVVNRKTNISEGFGYVEFEKRSDAEKALEYLDKGQIDGNVIRVQFTLVPKPEKRAPPPRCIHNQPFFSLSSHLISSHLDSDSYLIVLCVCVCVVCYFMIRCR
jgi:RNA recognition motif-containing protein